MKKFLFGSIGLSLALTVYAYAQTRSAEDGETLQQSLREKAVRIPARPTATDAGEEDQPRLARPMPRQPNWAEVRADLERTAGEDAQQQSSQQTLFRAQTRPLAPPPGLRALAASRLANVEPAEVDRVLIPLLLPAHPDIRDKLKVYGMENVYTATAVIDENASLSITGTCNRVIGGDPRVVEFRKRLAAKTQRLSGTGAEYHISRNDFGVDLSFSKFGCGYVMNIECGNPADDQRCAADAFVTMLAESMILANPERAGGG